MEAVREVRRELVAKRFLLVANEDLSSNSNASQPTAASKNLRLSRIADWPWRGGIIRCASSNDPNHTQLKAMITSMLSIHLQEVLSNPITQDAHNTTVLVEYDDLSWEDREWLSVSAATLHLFLVEENLVLSPRPSTPMGSQHPALTFRPLIDTVGLYRSVTKLPIEFLTDLKVSFHSYSKLTIVWEWDANMAANLSNCLKNEEAVRAWSLLQCEQKILQETPSVLIGYRVKVYRSEGTKQWYTAVVNEFKESSKELVVVDDNVLQTHVQEPALTQFSILGRGVVESIVRGDHESQSARRSRASSRGLFVPQLSRLSKRRLKTTNQSSISGEEAEKDAGQLVDGEREAESKEGEDNDTEKIGKAVAIVRPQQVRVEAGTGGHEEAEKKEEYKEKVESDKLLRKRASIVEVEQKEKVFSSRECVALKEDPRWHCSSSTDAVSSSCSSSSIMWSHQSKWATQSNASESFLSPDSPDLALRSEGTRSASSDERSGSRSSALSDENFVHNVFARYPNAVSPAGLFNPNVRMAQKEAYLTPRCEPHIMRLRANAPHPQQVANVQVQQQGVEQRPQVYAKQHGVQHVVEPHHQQTHLLAHRQERPNVDQHMAVRSLMSSPSHALAPSQVSSSHLSSAYYASAKRAYESAYTAGGYGASNAPVINHAWNATKEELMLREQRRCQQDAGQPRRVGSEARETSKNFVGMEYERTHVDANVASIYSDYAKKASQMHHPSYYTGGALHPRHHQLQPRVGQPAGHFQGQSSPRVQSVRAPGHGHVLQQRGVSSPRLATSSMSRCSSMQAASRPRQHFLPPRHSSNTSQPPPLVHIPRLPPPAHCRQTSATAKSCLAPQEQPLDLKRPERQLVQLYRVEEPSLCETLEKPSTITAVENLALRHMSNCSQSPSNKDSSNNQTNTISTSTPATASTSISATPITASTSISATPITASTSTSTSTCATSTSGAASRSASTSTSCLRSVKKRWLEQHYCASGDESGPKRGRFSDDTQHFAQTITEPLSGSTHSSSNDQNVLQLSANKRRKVGTMRALPILQRPSLSQLKLTGASFVQDAKCLEVAPRLSKCRQCRLGRSQRYCRFFAFRKLRFVRQGQLLATNGFCDPVEDARPQDLSVWRPSNLSNQSERKRETHMETLNKLKPHFDKMLQEEREALAAHLGQDKRVAWKRLVSGVREVCDVCGQHLFNLHWVCPKCCLAVCFKCYSKKSKEEEEANTSKEISKTNELKMDEEASSGWLLCGTGVEHVKEELVLVQIIAGDALDELDAKLNAVLGIEEEEIHNDERSKIRAMTRPELNGVVRVSEATRGEEAMRSFVSFYKQTRCVVMETGMSKGSNMLDIMEKSFDDQLPLSLVDLRTGQVTRRPSIDFWKHFHQHLHPVQSVCLRTLEPLQHMNNTLSSLLEPMKSFLDLCMDKLPNLIDHLPTELPQPHLRSGLQLQHGVGLDTELISELVCNEADLLEVVVAAGKSNVDFEQLVEFVTEELKCHKDDLECLVQKREVPVAIHQVFSAQHVELLVQLAQLQSVADLINTKIQRDQLQSLYTQHSIKPSLIVQFEGDALLLPPASFRRSLQVRSSVSVVREFVSEWHIDRALSLPSACDRLHLKSILFHTVKDALAQAQTHADDNVLDKQ